MGPGVHRRAEVPSVLVAYYSRTGNTKKMAELVAGGAREVPGVEVTVRPVEEVSAHDLLEFDGIIMGSPVYFGSMASELKSLIDQSVKHYGKMNGKVGGAFASCAALGGGIETTVMDILKAMLIHGMVVVGDTSCAFLGAVAIGAPDDERSQTDCAGLGRRVAELTARLAE
jgi:NAD(P)H dehydrogenase (quinone)